MYPNLNQRLTQGLQPLFEGSLPPGGTHDDKKVSLLVPVPRRQMLIFAHTPYGNPAAHRTWYRYRGTVLVMHSTEVQYSTWYEGLSSPCLPCLVGESRRCTEVLRTIRVRVSDSVYYRLDYTVPAVFSPSRTRPCSPPPSPWREINVVWSLYRLSTRPVRRLKCGSKSFFAGSRHLSHKHGLP